MQHVLIGWERGRPPAPPAGRQTGSVKEESGLVSLTTFHLAPQFKEILQTPVIACSAPALVLGKAAFCSNLAELSSHQNILCAHVCRVKWRKSFRLLNSSLVRAKRAAHWLFLVSQSSDGGKSFGSRVGKTGPVFLAFAGRRHVASCAGANCLSFKQRNCESLLYKEIQASNQGPFEMSN